jgi:hypothetical protein
MYNEEAVVPILRGELERFITGLPCEVEVVPVNDRSSDRTLEQIADWAPEDSRIKVVHL